MIVMQNNQGKYCSELINGRYQILESAFMSSSYYVYDHLKNKNIYQNVGNYHFNSIDAAMAKCTGEVTKKTSTIAPIVTKNIVTVTETKIVVEIPEQVIINKVIDVPKPVNKFAGAFAKFKKI